MRICTWNVAALRALHKKDGLLPWLVEEQADIICLQETKTKPEQLPADLRDPLGYRTHLAAAKKAGYSGVAVFDRTGAQAEHGLGVQELDDEGRTIQIDTGAFVLLCCYFPNSGAAAKRLSYKLTYNDTILKRYQELRSRGREVIICGDLNVAHKPVDLSRPKANEKKSGYLPEERAWMDRALAAGLVDIFRYRNPDLKEAYTWWSYRTAARGRNIGWRLDYFLLSPGLVNKVTDVQHLTKVMGSDHCPVRLDIDC